MRHWKTRLRHCFYRRLWREHKFPKGDLLSFLFRMSRQGFEPTHVVDIGANCGKWSRKFRKVFPDCNFTLVEPQIEMKPYLDRFCRDSKGACWVNAGAGSVLGQLRLSVAPDTVSSSFTISAEHARLAKFEQRIVPMITLDHLVANVIGVYPEVVKIGAEGFEAEVMEGAKTLIGRTELFLLRAPLINPPPNWPSFLEIVSMMDRYGYVPYDFTSFHKRPANREVASCEIAFVRENCTSRWSGGLGQPVARAA